MGNLTLTVSNPIELWNNTRDEALLQFQGVENKSLLQNSQFSHIESGVMYVTAANAVKAQRLNDRFKVPIFNTLQLLCSPDLELVNLYFISQGSSHKSDPINVASRRTVVSSNGHKASSGPPSVGLQIPPENKQSTVKPGQALIQLINADPQKKGFVSIPHYTLRFWRPFLGSYPFALWSILRSYGWDAQFTNEWPTIQLLADTIGQGGRSKILGRAACNGRKPQIGAIDKLQAHNILKCVKKGVATHVSYCFHVHDNLPILTPSQIATLPKSVQVSHLAFLSRMSDFDVQLWETITDKTLCKSLMSRT